MYEIMGVLIESPLLALGPALLLAGLWRATGSRACLVGAAAWLVYGAYEEAVHLRILCSGECNIRVDLLLIYPLLLLLSLAALLGAASRLRTGRGRARASALIPRRRPHRTSHLH